MTLKLSVIIPVYNERENLVPLLREIETVLRPLHLSFEVILVDDGSRDGSFELIERLVGEKEYLKAIHFRSNFGQTAAFDAGFQHAAGEMVVTLDADLQNDPQNIPALLSKLEEGYDFVAGWRRKRHDNLWLRVLPSRMANLIIRWVTGTTFHDLGCSLRAYRREILEDLRLYGEMHRFISVLLEARGAKGTEVEVNHRPRFTGRSNYSLARTLKVLLDLLTVWFLKGYWTKPIYIFGGIGSGCLALSVLLLGVVIWEKFAFAFKVHRNPLFIGSIFFSIIGIQFLVLGLLAELIIRSYFESRGKLPYSIAKKIGFNHPVASLSNN